MNNPLIQFGKALLTLSDLEYVPNDLKTFNSQALYSSLLDNELLNQNSPEDFKASAYIQDGYLNAVKLCRKNEFYQAFIKLQEIDILLEKLSGSILRFSTLFKLSGWGYYYYKTKEQSKGIDLLSDGLIISAELERAGYPTLIYRRIEQVHNIATIHFSMNNMGYSNSLIKNILNYLRCGHASGLIIDDWDSGIISKIRILQESNLDATFQDLAIQNSMYMYDPEYDNNYYNNFFFKELLDSLDTDLPNRAIMYNWMFTKASYSKDNPNEFLKNTILFLSDENILPVYDAFKANLLAHVIFHLRTIEENSSKESLIEIIKNFTKKKLLHKSSQYIKLDK